MMALRRRLLRLETANGRHTFAHLPDGELDARLRAELAAWIRDEPDACAEPVRADMAALLHTADAGSAER